MNIVDEWFGKGSLDSLKQALVINGEAPQLILGASSPLNNWPPGGHDWIVANATWPNMFSIFYARPGVTYIGSGACFINGNVESGIDDDTLLQGISALTDSPIAAWCRDHKIFELRHDSINKYAPVLEVVGFDIKSVGAHYTQMVADLKTGSRHSRYSEWVLSGYKPNLRPKWIPE